MAIHALPMELFMKPGIPMPSTAPLPLPPGFEWRPTPEHCKCRDVSLYILVMGRGYPNIVGRLLPWDVHAHDAEDPECWWALEVVSYAYCIRFQGKVQNEEGVLLKALGEPPTPPPGAVFNFYQRKPTATTSSLSKTRTKNKSVKKHQLKAKKVIKGRPRVKDAARADGCIGLMVARVPEDGHDKIDSMSFFARVAYDKDKWPSPSTLSTTYVARRVVRAVKAGMRASPFSLSLVPQVYICPTQGSACVAKCPRVIWDQAPVSDTEPVVIIMFSIKYHHNCNDSTVLSNHWLNSVFTRFLHDTMLADPGLAVVPQEPFMAIKLFTNKTPGLMNVHSASQGVPICTKSGTRPIKNIHPTCAITRIEVHLGDPKDVPVAPVPELDSRSIHENPLFQAMMTPCIHPLTLRGCEVSIYSPVDGTTLMAGTRHSWVCLGALTYDRVMRPYDPVTHPLGLFDNTAGLTLERRRSSFDLLHPALYNVTALETFWDRGRWASPDATRRAFWRPYALDNSVLTAAVFWVFGYPGFLKDWTMMENPNNTWHLKTYAKAYLEFAAKYGRIVRMLLNNRARNIRRDYSDFVLRTYYCATDNAQKPMRLVDTFRDCIVLGDARQDSSSCSSAFTCMDNVKPTTKPAKLPKSTKPMERTKTKRGRKKQKPHLIKQQHVEDEDKDNDYFDADAFDTSGIHLDIDEDDDAGHGNDDGLFHDFMLTE